MSRWTVGFDTYDVKARLFPGFLCALPFAALVSLLWPASPVIAVLAIFVPLGAPFFLANWVRGRGKALEAQLTLNWDGLPTTQLLRHRGAGNSVQRERWHRGLQYLTGVEMPTAKREARDPRAADDSYVAAVRILVNRVNADNERFPRVREELINYGFRRNLVAMRPTGLVVSLVCSVVSISMLVFASDNAASAVASAVSLGCLLLWARTINGAWVRQTADVYAIRLLESIDEIVGAADFVR